jgi:hypothetical protein
VTGKTDYKDKCEKKASEYADIVARGGVGVSYNEAFTYYMDKYLPKYKKKELTNGKAH